MRPRKEKPIPTLNQRGSNPELSLFGWTRRLTICASLSEYTLSVQRREIPTSPLRIYLKEVVHEPVTGRNTRCSWHSPIICITLNFIFNKRITISFKIGPSGTSIITYYAYRTTFFKEPLSISGFQLCPNNCIKLTTFCMVWLHILRQGHYS